MAISPTDLNYLISYAARLGIDESGLAELAGAPNLKCLSAIRGRALERQLGDIDRRRKIEAAKVRGAACP